MVGEIALALVLLIGGGLLVRSAIGLSGIDWGFDTNDLAVVAVRPGVGLHPLRSSRADQAQFANSVLERLGGFPDIQAVGVTNMAPLVPSSATIGERVVADGRPLTTAATASRAVVSGGYFGALGMEVRGRAFNESDDALGPNVAVLSESLARELFRGAQPIGQTVHFATLKDSAIEGSPVFEMIAVGGSVDIDDFEITGRTAHTVIGVANDIRLSGDPTAGGSGPTVYLDYRQHDRPLDPVTRGFLAGTSFGGGAGNPDLLATFVVRATGDDPQAAIEATKRAIVEVQPSLSFQEAAAMEQLISRALGGAGQSRLLLVLSTAFGVLALLLAGAGVYGVVAHRAAQRTYEIGVRLAIGCPPDSHCRSDLQARIGSHQRGSGSWIGWSRRREPHARVLGFRDHNDRCIHVCRRHDPVGAGRPGGQPHTGHSRNQGRPRRDNTRGVAVLTGRADVGLYRTRFWFTRCSKPWYAAIASSP